MWWLLQIILPFIAYFDSGKFSSIFTCQVMLVEYELFKKTIEAKSTRQNLNHFTTSNLAKYQGVKEFYFWLVWVVIVKWQFSVLSNMKSYIY